MGTPLVPEAALTRSVEQTESPAVRCLSSSTVIALIVDDVRYVDRLTRRRTPWRLIAAKVDVHAGPDGLGVDVIGCRAK